MAKNLKYASLSDIMKNLPEIIKKNNILEHNYKKRLLLLFLQAIILSILIIIFAVFIRENFVYNSSLLIVLVSFTVLCLVLILFLFIIILFKNSENVYSSNSSKSYKISDNNFKKVKYNCKEYTCLILENLYLIKIQLEFIILTLILDVTITSNQSDLNSNYAFYSYFKEVYILISYFTFINLVLFFCINRDSRILFKGRNFMVFQIILFLLIIIFNFLIQNLKNNFEKDTVSVNNSLTNEDIESKNTRKFYFMLCNFFVLMLSSILIYLIIKLIKHSNKQNILNLQNLVLLLIRNNNESGFIVYSDFNRNDNNIILNLENLKFFREMESDNNNSNNEKQESFVSNEEIVISENSKIYDLDVSPVTLIDSNNKSKTFKDFSDLYEKGLKPRKISSNPLIIPKSKDNQENDIKFKIQLNTKAKTNARLKTILSENDCLSKDKTYSVKTSTKYQQQERKKVKFSPRSSIIIQNSDKYEEPIKANSRLPSLFVPKINIPDNRNCNFSNYIDNNLNNNNISSNFILTKIQKGSDTQKTLFATNEQTLLNPKSEFNSNFCLNIEKESFKDEINLHNSKDNNINLNFNNLEKVFFIKRNNEEFHSTSKELEVFLINSFKKNNENYSHTFINFMEILVDELKNNPNIENEIELGPFFILNKNKYKECNYNEEEMNKLSEIKFCIYKFYNRKSKDNNIFIQINKLKKQRIVSDNKIIVKEVVSHNVKHKKRSSILKKRDSPLTPVITHKAYSPINTLSKFKLPKEDEPNFYNNLNNSITNLNNDFVRGNNRKNSVCSINSGGIINHLLVEKLSALLHDFKHIINDHVIYTETLLNKILLEFEARNLNDNSYLVEETRKDIECITTLKLYACSLIQNITNFMSNNNNFLMCSTFQEVNILEIVDLMVRIFNRRLEYDNNQNILLDEINLIRSPSFVSKNIKIFSKIKNEEKLKDFKILSNKDLLISIFYNILSNSYKYTNKGKIVVKVDFEKIEFKSTSNIVVSINDTGSGIPLDILNNWGVAFNLKDKSKGTGLGQFIISSIAKNLGLTIPKPKNNKQGGTKIKIIIPLNANNINNEYNNLITRSDGASIVYRNQTVENGNNHYYVTENERKCIFNDLNSVYYRTIYILCLDDNQLSLTSVINLINKKIKSKYLNWKIELMACDNFSDLLDFVTVLLRKNITIDFFILDQNLECKIKGTSIALVIDLIYKDYKKYKVEFFILTEDEISVKTIINNKFKLTEGCDHQILCNYCMNNNYISNINLNGLITLKCDNVFSRVNIKMVIKKLKALIKDIYNN